MPRMVRIPATNASTFYCCAPKMSDACYAISADGLKQESVNDDREMTAYSTETAEAVQTDYIVPVRDGWTLLSSGTDFDKGNGARGNG